MPIQRHKSMPPGQLTSDMIQHHVTNRRGEENVEADVDDDDDEDCQARPETIRFSAAFDNGGLILGVSWDRIDKSC